MNKKKDKEQSPDWEDPNWVAGWIKVYKSKDDKDD